MSVYDPYLEVDIDELLDLKQTYECTMDYIVQEYNFNLKSAIQLKNFFITRFGITLRSVKIEEIKRHISSFNENSEERELIQGVIYFLQLQYAVKNYINYFLKKNIKGKVYLARDCFGSPTLLNHRPLPASPEILQCISGAGNGLEVVYNNQDEVSGFVYTQQRRAV